MSKIIASVKSGKSGSSYILVGLDTPRGDFNAACLTRKHIPGVRAFMAKWGEATATILGGLADGTEYTADETFSYEDFTVADGKKAGTVYRMIVIGDLRMGGTKAAKLSAVINTPTFKDMIMQFENSEAVKPFPKSKPRRVKSPSLELPEGKAAKKVRVTVNGQEMWVSPKVAKELGVVAAQPRKAAPAPRPDTLPMPVETAETLDAHTARVMKMYADVNAGVGDLDAYEREVVIYNARVNAHNAQVK